MVKGELKGSQPLSIAHLAFLFVLFPLFFLYVFAQLARSEPIGGGPKSGLVASYLLPNCELAYAGGRPPPPAAPRAHGKAGFLSLNL